jgi:alkanesulfonate monooxygenase SsuD/methylene tetrahydromethanopterin reductase-like flavin-dependent oxidoreductase (luciferase family)
MRLGYFTMPVHPMHRNWADTLKEDREAIILADKLGFYDAFMGEHLTDACETITNSMMFHATLIPETKQIKLATGTSNLSHMHPVLIAVQAAMFDHMSEGRFILGVSPGALTTDAEALGILDQDRDNLFEGRFILGIGAGVLRSDAEALGLLDEDRNKLFAEAIDVILAIWERDPPYDIDFPDNRFKVSTARTMTLDLGVGIMAKPYQKPRPEIVGTVVAPFSPGVVLMGKRDFHPLSANFLLSKHLKSHWENYCKGKAEAGAEANVADWRVARAICVLDDDKMAARYGRDDPNSPYRFYYEQMRAKMKRGKRLYVFKSHKEQPDEEITHDYVMEHCVIHGGVSKVVDQILALREEIGDFGELVYAGMDWAEPALNKRSMQLMAEEVMPRVNAAIGKSAAAA